jgi:hypothetical protein
MSVPICGSWGISRTVSLFPGVTVATLCWEFGLQQSLIFSRLMRIHTHGDSLIHIIILGKSTFFITGAVPCHSAILYQVSHTLSHSLKWYRRYVSIRIRANLWFSHFPFYQFCWKIVSCCFLEWKQSKFAWYHMKVGYLGDFSHEGPSVGDSLSAGLFLVLLVESQMHPQIQRWSLSLCVTYS